MEILTRIIGIAAILLAIPGAVALLDKLAFSRMDPTTRLQYLQTRKDLIDHLMRKRIGADDIKAAFGFLGWSYPTILRYRAAVDKAVAHIITTRLP